MASKTKSTTRSTLLRQWAMLRKIPRSPKVIGTTALVAQLRDEGFDVDLRTIQRDLNNLSEIMPLASDQHKPQGWSWLPRAGQLDIPGMEPQTALALHVAQEHLRSALPASILDTIQPWFEMARNVLDAHGNGFAKWPQKIRVLPRGLKLHVPAIDPTVQTAVYEAVLLERKLSIEYISSGDAGRTQDGRQHVVSPLALVLRNGIVYLVCLYEGYSDPRQLALHRMRAAELLDDSARLPKEFSIDDYIAKGEFGIALNPSPIKLEAKFCREVGLFLLESPIADNQTVTKMANGEFLLRATVPDTIELRLWLKSFGDEVLVLKPIAMQHEFRDMVRTLKALYLP